MADARGVRDVRAGISSARRWPPNTWASQFDIHGGGLDLVFPHHENERAQTDCGMDFERDAEMARFWMHHGLLNVSGGEKMSKSLGNMFLVDDVLRETRPQVLRYYLLAVALPVGDRVRR